MHIRSSLTRTLIVFVFGMVANACSPPPSGNACNGLQTPFDFMAEALSDEIRLSWQGNSTDIGVYNIERATNVSGPYQLYVQTGAGGTQGVNSFSFSDQQVQPGVEYCYRVQSQHANGTRGCFTNPACAVISECDDQAMPFDVRATPWSESEFRLSWQGNSTDVEVYNIERAPEEYGPYQHHAEVETAGSGINSFSFSDEQIEVGQFGVKYCYRIQAHLDDGTRGCFTDPVCTELVVQ